MTVRNDDAFPFEKGVERELSLVRRDPNDEPTLSGYEPLRGGVLPIPGDETAPFSWAIGRASEDGEGDAGEIPAVSAGQPQKVLVDTLGRIWVNVAPGSVQDVQGNIANDEPDAGSFPVKVGGIAVADFSGQAVAVAVDDRVNAAYDLNGRQLVVPQGNVAHDAVDAGQPNKIGGRATSGVLGFAAVANGDRTDAAYDLNGKLITSPQGSAAHDAVDNGNPVKVGGRAAASGGFAAVAVGDRSDIAVDVNGRLLVNVDAGTATLAANVQGNLANDAPDGASNPVKVGGRAVANGAVGAAVAAADRVDAAYSLNGAQHALTSPNPITDATSYAYSSIGATVGDAQGRLIIKANPGRLRRVLVVNNHATNTLYAQVHNTNAVGTVATGTMMTPGMPIPAGSFGYFDFSEADLCLSTGVAVALSATQTTWSNPGATGQFSAQYA